MENCASISVESKRRNTNATARATYASLSDGNNQRTRHSSTVDQLVTVWKDEDVSSDNLEHDVEVHTESGHCQKINYHYSCYDPFQYPLLFPLGELGWNAAIEKVIKSGDSTSTKWQKKCAAKNVANFNLVQSEDHPRHDNDGILLHISFISSDIYFS